MHSLHAPNKNFKQLTSLILVLAFWTNVVCAAVTPAPVGAAKPRRDAVEESSGVVDLLRERINSGAPKTAPADKSAGTKSGAGGA